MLLIHSAIPRSIPRFCIGPFCRATPLARNRIAGPWPPGHLLKRQSYLPCEALRIMWSGKGK